MPTNTLNPLALIDTAGEAFKALAKRKVQFAAQNGTTSLGIGGGAYYMGADGWNYVINQNGGAPDFASLTGDPLRNRVVAACVNAKARAMASAPSIIEHLEGGQWKRIDHDAANLLNAPNDYHSYYDIQFATTAYEDTKAQGFWRIEFDRSGNPAELWPEHPDKFRILGTSDKYISGYTFTQESGGVIDLEDREVIHFRRALDLYNGRLGWTPLFAAYPQIHGDNAAAIYQSAILDNAGVMSLLVSMKEGLTVGNSVVTGQIEAFVAALKRKLAERGAGSIAGVNLPLDVNKMGYSPDEMSIPDLIRYFMVSICALLEVDPAMIRMAGGADSPTYANFEVIERDFWHRTIVPANLQRDATLTTQYLPLWNLDPKTHRVNRDYSQIPALQENMAEVSTRVCGEFKVGIIDRWTAKTRLNYEVTDADKEVYASPGQAPPDAGDGEDTTPPDAVAATKSYDPRQPRDDLGKWTEGAGGRLSVGHALHVMKAEGITDEKHHQAVREAIENGTHQTREDVLRHIDAIHNAPLVPPKNGAVIGSAPRHEWNRIGGKGVAGSYYAPAENEVYSLAHRQQQPGFHTMSFGDGDKVLRFDATPNPDGPGEIAFNHLAFLKDKTELARLERDYPDELGVSLLYMDSVAALRAKQKGLAGLVSYDRGEISEAVDLRQHSAEELEAQVAAILKDPVKMNRKSITLNGQEVHLMNGKADDETKAIDPTDETLPWTDEQLAAATEISEDDVKFALGSSTPDMRELLRTQPNDKAGES